jgi:DNA modification methylase
MSENKIVCGDCLDVIKKMPSESVDLIYLDPPFSSNREYVGFWQKTGEQLVFDDHWEAGVAGYIEWLTPRIKECYRVLKSTGSLYLHCDWHANAHIRIMLDKIFGVNNFRNEIIWRYYQGGKSNKQFARKHDTLFFYTKDKNNWTFNADSVRVPYAKSTIERYKTPLQDKKMHTLNPKGQIISDIWLDLHSISRSAKERLGYPTQKPEALLERIINVSSNKGDIILDPYCGCGTTIAVAAKLNRHFIGIDISRLAIKVMDNRLKNLRNILPKGFDWNVVIPNTINTIKEYDWFNFQTWVNEKLGALQGKRGADGGIDGTTWHQFTVIPCECRKKNIPVPEGTPIQTKHYGKGEGTIGEPDLKKFKTTIEKENKTEGIMVGWNFARPTAYEFVLWAKERGINIYLLKAEELYKLQTLESPYKQDYKVDRRTRIEDVV